MLLLEHDAKTLLAEHGIPVPDGFIVKKGAPVPEPSCPPPWMVKAQVPVGGRGKSGAIKKVVALSGLSTTVAHVLELRVRSFKVDECLIEQAIADAEEYYVSLSIDPNRCGVAVILSSEGGVDIEAQPKDKLAVGFAPLSLESLQEEIRRLAVTLPASTRETIGDAAEKLARVFMSSDLALLEINPLLSLPDGTWIAGDAKIIFDENALSRQPFMENLLAARDTAYPADSFKHTHGFDFIVLDPAGEVGLITTGAGLTMKVIDELNAENVTPFNFCDIRSGMMRGDPARLKLVLSQISEGPQVKAILVNIFAGITNLGEFAQLLIEAVRTADGPRVPFVTRLIGNAAEDAARILHESDLPFLVENDLDAAIAKVVDLAHGSEADNA
ncbi:MAG: hypothetical protein OEY85_03800 [Rhodospirillales bacterium]|nr:hypothetical protein [Rhodospirillales bacterium]